MESWSTSSSGGRQTCTRWRRPFIMKMICRILFGVVPASGSGSVRRHHNGRAPAGGSQDVRIHAWFLLAVRGHRTRVRWLNNCVSILKVIYHGISEKIKFRVPKTTSTKTTVFWTAVQCKLIKTKQRFRDPNCIIITLMVETVNTSETSVKF